MSHLRLEVGSSTVLHQRKFDVFRVLMQHFRSKLAYPVLANRQCGSTSGCIISPF